MKFLIMNNFEISIEIEQILKGKYEIEYVNDNQAYGGDKQCIIGVICNGFFRYNDIKDFPNLKFIQLLSMGMDQIDLEYCKKHFITVKNAGDTYAIPIAEYVVGALLTLFRGIHLHLHHQKEKQWIKIRQLQELNEQKAMILGTGNIGREIAKRLKAFNVYVCGYNQSGKKVDYFDQVIHQDLYEHLSHYDIVVCTLPLTDKTNQMINDDFFTHCKNGIVFVNVSRGQLVDELSLIRNMKQGKVDKAILDVYEQEPLNPESELYTFKHCILSPHNSYVSTGNYQRLKAIIANNIRSIV